MKDKSIFDFVNFENFLQKVLVKNSQFEHGYKKNMALNLNLHPTTLSQIFSGVRNFSEEQVFLLSDFLNLDTLEKDYLIVLFKIHMANNKAYKEYLLQKKIALKNKSLNLSHRLEKDHEIKDVDKAIFFSSWHYSCIFVFLSLGNGKELKEISNRFSLSLKKCKEVLDFLQKIGLCSKQNSKYVNLNQQIHLEKNSPFLKLHHNNWRSRAILKMENSTSEDLTFTAPLTLSNQDYLKLRESMVLLIQKVSETAIATDAEDVFNFNLDFYRV